MSEEDIALDEKRIYGEKRETTVAYVASETGLARVEVSGDQVGRISLVQAEPVSDVAGAAGRLLVAAEDVHVGDHGDLAATGFGTAAAVGATPDRLLAVSSDGHVAELTGDDWRRIGTVDDPRRMDGTYLATGDGVVRVREDDLGYAGLSRVRDVADAGPYAATAEGVYGQDRGEWRTARGEPAERVAASAERLHVVDDGTLYDGRDGAWTVCTLPVDEPVADVAYGEVPYAVTVDGTFLVDADPETTPDGSGGWRHRSLGLHGVTALAVP